MYLRLKTYEPFIEDAVKDMHNDGIQDAIALVLAPHYSTFSVKSYVGQAQEEARENSNLTIHGIDSWYKEQIHPVLGRCSERYI